MTINQTKPKRAKTKPNKNQTKNKKPTKIRKNNQTQNKLEKQQFNFLLQYNTLNFQ